MFRAKMKLSAMVNPVKIRESWRVLQNVPGGKYLFSKFMGWVIPYTGKMSALVQKVESGSAEVQLPDRRKVRNHLNSIHALAIANLGEFCCGLALFSRTPANAVAILVELGCAYHKKARGTLTAKAQCEASDFQTDTNYPLKAEIFNQEGELVATVTTVWRVRLV